MRPIYKTIFTRIRLACLLLVLSVIGATAGTFFVDLGHYVVLLSPYPPPRLGWFFPVCFAGVVGLGISLFGILILLISSVVRCNIPSRHARVQLLATFVMGILAGLSWKTFNCDWAGRSHWDDALGIGWIGTTILATLIAWIERKPDRSMRNLFMLSMGGMLLIYVLLATAIGCKKAILAAREAKYTGRIQFDEPLTDQERCAFFEQIRNDKNLQNAGHGYTKHGGAREIKFMPTTNVMADLVDVKGFEFTKIGPNTCRAKRLTNNVPDAKAPRSGDTRTQIE